MSLRVRLLSSVGLMLVVPLLCDAQERVPPSERAVPEAVMPASSNTRLGDARASAPRSGRRDSLLNGAVIGLAAGAALGIAYAHAVRDADLDAGDYASSALIAGGLGAAAGLGIDALVDHNPSVVVRSPPRVTLRPRVSRTTAGLRVVLRW